MAALVVGALVAVAGLVALAITPRGTPADPAAPTAVAVSPAQAPSDDPDRGRTGVPQATGPRVDLRELAEQVSAIRELPLKRQLRSRVLDEATLAQKVSDLAFAELDLEEVAADERLLEALRLAPPGLDLVGITEALYREQILGLYVPEERMLYVKGGSERASAAQRVTSAHEITHALQDQSFGLVPLQDAVEDDSEASLALLSLIEGDAILTQQLWAEAHQSAAERQEALRDTSTGGDTLAAAPEYLRNSLFFPYQHGGSFVAELYSRGGFDAVDEAFAQPPTTSEQILHPEKYLAREGADDVEVEQRPPQGWRHDTTYEFGQFDLQQLMAAVGSAQASAVSQGWGGGEVRSWTRDGRTAVAFVLSFDSVADATEACDALPRWYAQVAQGQAAAPGLYAGDRDHFALDCRGDHLTGALAEDAGLARSLAGLD